MNQVPRPPRFHRRLLAGLVDLLYPPTCLHCGLLVEPEADYAFCTPCLHQVLALVGEACPRCAAPAAPFTISEGRCDHCKGNRYAFTKTIALGPYRQTLRSLILHMKHPFGEPVGFHLAMLLASHFRTELLALPIDAVVPVPLHWSRRLWRGYNQAAVLAEVLAHQLDKPYRPGWLWRRRHTPRQTSVAPGERRQNVHRAFAARIPITAKSASILLVDDVMTTGSTANACARTLRAAGARAVSVAVLARAVALSPTDPLLGMP